MANSYAVVENTLVTNLVVAEPDYAQAQGWVEAPVGVSIGWSYIDGQFVAPVPPAPTPEEIQAQNKSEASALLSATDWTTIPDVADPAISNPYLTNAAEFAAWRSQVRAIAVNPPTTPAVFPEQPTEQWSN